MKILIFIGITVIAFAVFVVLCCLKMSGDISKIEEGAKKD